MSGFSSKVVKYNDPWDVGKMDSKEESYQLHWHGTSDTIEFQREGKMLVGLSKGDAWLFMKALEHYFEYDEPQLFNQPNPFKMEEYE